MLLQSFLIIGAISFILRSVQLTLQNIHKPHGTKKILPFVQEWRNTSTHDFKLIFNESEAFIALMSVSSFVHLLLKQILEKISFNFEQVRLESEKASVKELQKIVLKEGGTLGEKLIKVLLDFAKRDNFIKVRPAMLEHELHGTLHAYLATAGFKVIPEPSFKYLGMRIIPDFLIQNKNEKVVLETAIRKRVSKSGSDSQQLLNYMIAAKVTEGVFFYTASLSKRTEPKVETMQINIEWKNYVLHMINA